MSVLATSTLLLATRLLGQFRCKRQLGGAPAALEIDKQWRRLLDSSALTQIARSGSRDGFLGLSESQISFLKSLLNNNNNNNEDCCCCFCFC
ncbi:GSCOCG00007231001-RA-CDS [Cotesia congregata]|nr:GSCOCG00007231001-RA-CDS [Cotesia congregata]